MWDWSEFGFLRRISCIKIDTDVRNVELARLLVDTASANTGYMLLFPHAAT